MCPFAQKVAIALNYAYLDYTSQTVSLYSSSGPFPKSKLREVESNYGLTPKGYIPVLLHEVEESNPVCLQESDDILDYIASLDESLKPSNLENHSKVRRALKALPTNTNKPGSLLTTLDGICSTSAYLGGNSFSTTDCIALPFLQRIKETHSLEGFDKLNEYYSKLEGEEYYMKSCSSEWWWWW